MSFKAVQMRSLMLFKGDVMATWQSSRSFVYLQEGLSASLFRSLLDCILAAWYMFDPVVIVNALKLVQSHLANIQTELQSQTKPNSLSRQCYTHSQQG